MKTTKAQKLEAIARLREILKPGDTVYTVLRSVSRSGMSRGIDVYALKAEPDGTVGKRWLSRYVAIACGFTFDEKHECLKVGGCGMDMGFHVVENVAYTLFPDGFECTSERCPSTDHANGDRDYTPHHHKSGGYALRHEWI